MRLVSFGQDVQYCCFKDLVCKEGDMQLLLLSSSPLLLLRRCVGTATAAFAQAVLEGSTQPGVWYSEEVRATHRNAVQPSNRTYS